MSKIWQRWEERYKPERWVCRGQTLPSDGRVWQAPGIWNRWIRRKEQGENRHGGVRVFWMLREWHRVFQGWSTGFARDVDNQWRRWTRVTLWRAWILEQRLGLYSTNNEQELCTCNQGHIFDLCFKRSNPATVCWIYYRRLFRIMVILGMICSLWLVVNIWYMW